MKQHTLQWLHGASTAVRRSMFHILATVGVAVLTAAAPGIAQAQSTTVTACAVTGSATVTIAGIATTLPIGCLNQAQQTGPGTTTQTAANVSTPTLLGLANLANVEAPYSEADDAETDSTITFGATTKASSVQLINGMVTAQDLHEVLNCTWPTNEDTVTCLVGTAIANLLLGGQVQTLPAPIPLNYSLPLQGNVTVLVAGLPVTVGVSGTVVLNEAVSNYDTSTDTLTIEHAQIHVRLAGQAMSGVQLIGVNIDVADYGRAKRPPLKAGQKPPPNSKFFPITPGRFGG